MEVFALQHEVLIWDSDWKHFRQMAMGHVVHVLLWVGRTCPTFRSVRESCKAVANLVFA